MSRDHGISPHVSRGHPPVPVPWWSLQLLQEGMEEEYLAREGKSRNEVSLSEMGLMGLNVTEVD